MRKMFKKFQPRVIHCRSYKHFSSEYFRKCLLEKLSKEVLVNNDNGFQRFCDINITALNEHAPSNKKCAQGNQMPFLTEDLSRAAMRRSKLRSQFLNKKTKENRAHYVKQRKYKRFQKTVKPLLSDKLTHVVIFIRKRRNRKNRYGNS